MSWLIWYRVSDFWRRDKKLVVGGTSALFLSKVLVHTGSLVLTFLLEHFENRLVSFGFEM